MILGTDFFELVLRPSDGAINAMCRRCTHWWNTMAALCTACVAITCSGCASHPLTEVSPVPVLGGGDFADECGQPFYGDDVPDAGEACSAPNVGLASGIVSTVCGSALSCVGTAGSAVGHVANFCVPPAGYMPLEGPPPGRFHPVPTRPVFCPR